MRIHDETHDVVPLCRGQLTKEGIDRTIWDAGNRIALTIFASFVMRNDGLDVTVTCVPLLRRHRTAPMSCVEEDDGVTFMNLWILGEVRFETRKNVCSGGIHVAEKNDL